MSAKRRRSSDINRNVFDQIEIERRSRGFRHPTTLAVSILLGSEDPVESVDLSAPSTRKSVSMPEWVWLGLKGRSTELATSIADVANRMLMGSLPPLTKEEIQLARESAAKNESTRPSYPRLKKKKKKPKASPVEKTEDFYDVEQREKRISKLPKGVPFEDFEANKDRYAKNVDSDEAYFGGVYSL